MEKTLNKNSLTNRLKRFKYMRILKYKNFILIVSSKNSNPSEQRVAINNLKSAGFSCLRLKTKVIRSLPFFSKIFKSLTGELFFVYSMKNDANVLNSKVLSEVNKTFNILYCIYNNSFFGVTKILPLLKKSKAYENLTLQNTFQQVSSNFIGSFYPIIITLNNYIDKKSS
jgi:hypothetical protein